MLQHKWWVSHCPQVIQDFFFYNSDYFKLTAAPDKKHETIKTLQSFFNYVWQRVLMS